MPTDPDAAWSGLHDAKPPGWYVGRPYYNERHKCPGAGLLGVEPRQEWEQYAFDPAEKAKVGVRSREWTAVTQSEVEVIRELARCLRAISEGQAPE